MLENYLFLFSYNQLLKDFEMTKPELERYVRHWARDCSKVTMVTLNQWMAWLHNSGKHQ
jgi:hypothetical protein